MSRTRVKICGITRQTDARAAVAAGADAIGLVFYSGSTRALAPAAARDVVAGLPAFVSVVGLFVNAERRDVIDACSLLPIALLQFHGDEDAACCASFGRPWMKAIRVADDTDIRAEIDAYAGASAILLDAYVRDAYGGTGQSFDWARIPADRPVPVILAGGLTPENVGSAILRARPYAVDVSGGVESEPGIKDSQLIQEFLSAVHAADVQLESRA